MHKREVPDPGDKASGPHNVLEANFQSRLATIRHVRSAYQSNFFNLSTIKVTTVPSGLAIKAPNPTSLTTVTIARAAFLDRH